MVFHLHLERLVTSKFVCMTYSRWGVSLFFLFLISVVGAEEELGYSDFPIKLDVGLGVGYDSNLYDTSSEIESTYFYQPNMQLGVEIDNGSWGGQAVYQYELFVPESSVDKTQTNMLTLNPYWSPTLSNTFSFYSLYDSSDEMRGSELTDDDPFSVEEVDHYTRYLFQGEYAFVNPNQQSVLFALGYREQVKEYDSTRSDALNANYEQDMIYARLGYQWSLKKKLYFQFYDIDKVHPDLSDQSLDSTNDILLVGLEWELSPAFNAFIEVGEDQQVFTVSEEQLNTDYWDITLVWSPRTYSHFSLQTVNTQEPLTESGQTLNEVTEYSLIWTHVWSDEYQSSIQLTQEQTDTIINGVNDTEVESLFSVSAYYRDIEFTINWEKEDLDDESYSQFSVLLALTLEGGF